MLSFSSSATSCCGGTMIEPTRTEREGFAHVLRAEWTTFRTGHVLMIGVLVAALLTALLGLCYVAINGMPCAGASTVCSPALVGPDGEAVDDKFYFVYQPLAGNGSITARLTSLTGEYAYFPPNANPRVPSIVLVPGVQPWAKAGVIIKESTTQGSAYAAMMLTGSHGVRMQDNFTRDIAGMSGGVSATSPRWLRLTRSGNTLTGAASTDGVHWTKVATAHLASLPATVQVGLFVTSPCALTVREGCGRLPLHTGHRRLRPRQRAGCGAARHVEPRRCRSHHRPQWEAAPCGLARRVRRQVDRDRQRRHRATRSRWWPDHRTYPERRGGWANRGDRGGGAVRHCRTRIRSQPTTRQPTTAARAGREGCADWVGHIHDPTARRRHRGPAWHAHHALERRGPAGEGTHRIARPGRDCGGKSRSLPSSPWPSAPC